MKHSDWVKQMRRSAVSIPSNISEGAVRNSTKEFTRFLYIALGSLTELETQIEISGRIGYLKHHSDLSERIVYIRRMLINLIKSLSKKENIG